MASFKKILIVSFISASLIAIPIRQARAIIPLVIPWLLVGSNLLVTDLIVGQIGILTALFWWDCNKFAVSAPCTTKNPIPSAQLPKPALTVNLQPDSKRENPNPAKFNDPAPGKRDVTPKTQIAAAGSGPPPAPAGPIGTGIYAQNPNDPSTGPSADETLKYMAQQSHNYGDVYVAGVITVKQMFASDRAFPFVAKVVSCTYRTDIPSNSPEVQATLTACTAKQNNSNAALETTYLTPDRYSYWIGLGNTPGTIVAGKAVVFYDQAKDVTITCDPGYQSTGTYVNGVAQCGLVDAAQVKKPADTPCEMLFDPATKQIMTDPANPACAGMATTANLSVPSADGQSSIDVKANAGNGFDVCINKSDKSKTCFDTGIYDPGTGGYVIVHTTVTPPPDPNNGSGCGGPGQGMCAVTEPGDNDTWIKSNDTQTANRAADTGMKGKMDAISSGTFNWSFIPSIPTMACTNPSLKSPIGNATFNMDICVWFDRLSTFINAVVALGCLYGCVTQIQAAIRGS
jgi:hypothetical protein